MKHQIVCWGVCMVVSEGETKEEAIAKLPKLCQGCGSELDHGSLRWDGCAGRIHCSISYELFGLWDPRRNPHPAPVTKKN